MDRKHGKYVVNMEHPGKQSSSTCTNGQEAHHHTCWCPSSNDVTGNVSSNLFGVSVSPGILAHSECQPPEPCSTQVAGNSCGDWSLWKVFLASLLASVLTTVIGVLTLSLVNRNNSPIVIQLLLPSNTEASTVTPGTTSTTSQNIVATSTGSTTTMTSLETTATTATTTSTESARTSTSTQPTTSAASTETSATTATPMTSSGSMSTAASTQPTTSGAPTETSATTMDSTQLLTASSTASSETTSTTSVTETNV